MFSSTVTKCFSHLFSIFGMPDMVHNDRGTDFLSNETKSYLLNKNIASSNTSRYNPQGNGQVEKLNGTLWKAIQVTLHSRNMNISEWETVLPDALHSIRSLLCTATNCTPHERMFSFNRKSTSGKTIPSWVKPGPVYVRNHTRRSKNDPPVTPATLIHANSSHAHVRLPSGVETTVNIRDLVQQPQEVELNVNESNLDSAIPTSQETFVVDNNMGDVIPPEKEPEISEPDKTPSELPETVLRRSLRTPRPPKRLEDYVSR